MCAVRDLHTRAEEMCGVIAMLHTARLDQHSFSNANIRGPLGSSALEQNLVLRAHGRGTVVASPRPYFERSHLLRLW